jgi:hypothetical protein
METNNIITRSAFARASNTDLIKNRQVEFVISSESVDQHRTVFKLDGWDLAQYNANPIVCYQHRAGSDNPDDVIGLSEVFIEGDKLIGRITFEEADINPKAEKVFRKVQNGTLKMASISALPQKARLGVETDGEDNTVLYFTRQQLLEWSIVTVGSNPDALKRNTQVVETFQNQLRVNDIEVITPETITNENRADTLDVNEAQFIINKNL